jgi:HSP20 family protein
MLPIRTFNDIFDMDVTEKGNCDIYLEDGKYHVEMDLPGYEKKDIRLEAHKGSIIITAKKETHEEEKEGKKYVRRERTFGRIERSFYLGDIDEENITAEFKDGILRVTIPSKAEPEKKAITIE